MLASQISSASQVTKSNFLPSTATLRSIKSPRRYHHQHHQVRSFRIGLWSSYLDPAFEKELQRRRRIIKHKYTEALNRKLSWDRRLPAYATRWGLKEFMCSSWRAHDPRPGGRWVNLDQVKEVRDSAKSDSRCGIEEVEQDALDELFSRRNTQRSMHRDRSFGWNQATTESTPAGLAGKLNREGPEAWTSEKSASRYIKNDQETTATAEPEPEYDIDPISNRKVFRKDKVQPERGLPESTSTETEIPVKTFKGYWSQPSKFEPPLGNIKDTVIRLAQSTTQVVQDEADKYKPYKYNEPDGKIPEEPDSVSKGLSDFDHEYKPFKYNEPDGKFPEKPDPIEKGLNDYDQQMGNQSHPCKSSQADNEQSKFADSPTRFSNKGERLSMGSWLSQVGFSSSTGLGRGSQAATEPHEQRKTATIESPLYRSRSRLSAVSKPSIDIEDLDSLRASDIRAASGTLKEPRKETQTERDTQRTAPELDFDQIEYRRSSLADEIAAAQKVKASRQLAQDLEIELSYLLNFNAHAIGHVDAKIAELNAEIAVEKARSHTQKVTGNFVRDFPEEFSASWSAEGSSTKECLVPRENTDAWGYNKSPQGLENIVQNTESDYVADVASKGGPSHGTGSTKLETALQRTLRDCEKLQAERDPYTKESEGLDISYAKEAEEKGNYGSPLFVRSYGCKDKTQHDKELVREIRNIYESTYGAIDCNHHQNLKSDKDAKTPVQEGPSDDGLQAPIQNLEQEVREGQNQIREHYMDVAKAFAKQSSTEQQTPSVQEDLSSATHQDPTLYKILAYDPIMQAINMAETTSTVPDTSSALTPAEVLLRLSNPAKFFPHFQPLQSQGYEIVSGSGDVLVFRKARSGTPIASLQASPDSVVASTHVRKVVNPIDGMQSVLQPATGNFASPTGFVNHDLPSEHPFISGIDVRREEPVFSGRRTEWRNGEGDKEEPGHNRSKKFSRGVLVGAVGVGACSYAVGVVAEYFKTGGSDGKGPVGF